jgi:mono/diheme cytochrome c family protein
MRAKLALITITLVLIGGWWAFMRPPADQGQLNVAAGEPLAAVIEPASFTDIEQLGLTAFTAKCADCHGVNGAGRAGIAPPLVHKIYEPSHHSDMAFELAARNGVRAHHWPFGNMPPVEGLTSADIGAIVAYVRAMQRENGIN